MKFNFGKLRVLLLFLCMAISGLSVAQEVTISGKVTDASSQEPLIGVTIIINGTTDGTISDFDGNYRISAQKGQELIFSFIGYASQTIVVADQTSLNIGLEVDTRGLDEVIVIGYGTTKKEDLTGAIQTVSSSDFKQGAITSPQDLLNGKVSGVQITSGGGAPGSGTTIRIRGGSSLSASNDPLIIIDGVPLDNGDVSGMRNPLNAINPTDIETFTVLKDASATAIYGSRASNGVILITTKTGSKTGLHIEYNGNISVNDPTKTIAILSPEQYRELLPTVFPDNANLMGEANTRWMDEILSASVSTDHNVSLSGTIGDDLPFRASIGYNNSNGILETSEMERTTGSINLTPTFFDDQLRVNVSLKGMSIKNRFADTGAIGNAVRMDPTQMVRGETYSAFGGYYTWLDNSGTPIDIAPDNPLAMLNQKHDESDVTRFIGNLKLDYTLPFLPEMRATLNMGADFSKGEGDVVTDPMAAFDLAAYNRGGAVSTYEQKKENKILDFYLNYAKELPTLASRLDAMVGYSWQQYWYSDETEANFNEANADGDYTRDAYNLQKEENYLVSFFGRVNYVYQDKYLLTFTLRNDGSSRFSEDNRWGWFPSVALGWNMKKESFLAEKDWLSVLKLRLGYGITGQQDVNQNYGYFGVYNRGLSTASYVFHNPTGSSYDRVVYNTLRPQAYDENLKWEETTTYNIGIDYGFLNNRIYGSLEFYLRETNDLLNTIPIPAGSNLSNELLTNVGSLENKGVELSINADVIETNDWSWSVGANVTYNKNEITKLTQVDDPNYLGVLTGDIDGGTGNTVQIHQIGSAANSFFVYEQIYDVDGTPIQGAYVDRNGDGTVNENDLYVYKNKAPKVMLGLNTSVTYKNWDFSASGRANLGQYVYDNISSNGAFYNRLQTNGQYISNIVDDIYNTEFQSDEFFSDYYVQNASFFRLDNVTLGYRFNNVMNNKMNVRVYGSVDNVFVVSPYDGIDPEIESGIDNNIYPRPRIFMMGVNVSF